MVGNADDKTNAAQDLKDPYALPTLKIEALEASLAEMKDRWIRAEAEMANVRARARRDVQEAREFGVQAFAADVVETADNLRRGLANLPAETEAEPKSLSGLRSGLSEIERAFVAMLERNGILAIDPTGSAFIPEIHQAIGGQEVSDLPPGTVVQSIAPVWTLNGRLLRPAQVIISKEPTGPDQAAIS